MSSLFFETVEVLDEWDEEADPQPAATAGSPAPWSTKVITLVSTNDLQRHKKPERIRRLASEVAAAWDARDVKDIYSF